MDPRFLMLFQVSLGFVTSFLGEKRADILEVRQRTVCVSPASPLRSVAITGPARDFAQPPETPVVIRNHSEGMALGGCIARARLLHENPALSEQILASNDSHASTKRDLSLQHHSDLPSKYLHTSFDDQRVGKSQDTCGIIHR